MHSINPKIAFLSLRLLSLRRNKVDGFSLPVALIIFFVVLLAAASIANYTMGGLFAAVSQSDNREARDVAESGMAEIVSELNKERNRRLLVAGNSRYGIAGWPQNDSSLNNDCASLGVSSIVTPNFNVAPGPASARILGGESSQRRKYYIESINYLSQDQYGNRVAYSTPSVNVLTGLEKSFIRITVVGETSNGGRVNKSRIAREFEIVPKCCKRSFGNNLINASGYGNDRFSCLNDSRGGSGLVVGLNNGTFAGSRNTFDIINDEGVPITQARCWSGNLAGSVDSTNTQCISGDLTIGRTISAVPTDFDIVIPPYLAAPLTNSSTCSNKGGGYVCIDEGTGNNRIIRNYITIINGNVKACAVSGNSLASCEDLSRWGASCALVNGAANCKVTRIDLNGQNLIIDSTNGPISLYFDNPSCNRSGTYFAGGANNCSTSSPGAHDFLDGSNGNGTLTHVYCTATTLSQACTSPASLPQTDRLNLFVEDEGYLKLKGSTAALALNVIAPYASLDWAGGGSQNPNFLGRIWAHNLSLSGSISMQVEKTNPGWCTATTCPPEVGGLIDHKVRNYTQASGF